VKLKGKINATGAKISQKGCMRSKFEHIAGRGKISKRGGNILFELIYRPLLFCSLQKGS
jgi:hypothetical protein